ncbi:alpha/beta fold hydrolase [Kineococcus rubinsiae]|uniref:alpha/beta fold hydrolase n=1 Tax=Kineococcus rubinsiae TaxID=2609562 RepID=UPI001431B49E|nr:alpha/beta hydrolase [Kineococcus rubinsiae]NIZ93393.1 alpha/beta hydrolase [Kineococcus rubinsiae]
MIVTQAGMQKTARGLLKHHGHVLPRPVLPNSGQTFPLVYVRTGADRRVPGRDVAEQVPLLILPGGPGLASVLPYQRLRAAAAARGLDVLMVEHRGVGFSRHDEHGRDLPQAAVTLEQTADDLAAVLTHAGIERAVVYGSSYGTYLAQAFAVRHRTRVAAMVLDSPMLSVEADLATARAHRRALFWHGEDPALAPVAAAVRALAEDNGPHAVPMAELAHVVQLVHEFAGPEVLHRLVLARHHGRLQRTWRRIATLGAGELDGPGAPLIMEPDLVAGIAYRQLGFGLPPDGGPLDPQLTFAEAGARHSARGQAYAGEPFDLPAALPGFDFPIVVVSGDRDLRTPRPIAQRITALAPHAELVPLADTGHSALDSHQRAALLIAAATAAAAAGTNTIGHLPGMAPRIAALPRRGPSRLLGTAISAVVKSTTRPAATNAPLRGAR